ncbi:MAG: PAC2 family protein [Candidatus Bathyarchaeota archaeon]|nr:MAG: PAC2 family protein [Candidatus Bathyarchaeota archaeon]
MEIQYTSEPKLEEPVLIAAWPGMGYLAKISADYLRQRLKAKKFAEFRYFQNAIVYKDSLAELPVIRHQFFVVPEKGLMICVGDAQPSTPEEALSLAEKVIDVAEKYDVRRVYTMAAYPSDYPGDPRVFGVYTDERLKGELEKHGVEFIEGEGAVNGLNGILIGLAKMRGIEGVCLMGEIRYANVPQHLSSKAVLERLTSILGLDIDTAPLERRAEKIDASIRKSLGEFEEYEEIAKKEEKTIRYIS